MRGDIGVVTACAPGRDIWERLAWARRNGFTAVEVFASPAPPRSCGVWAREMSDPARERLKRETSGFRVRAVHAPFRDVFGTNPSSANPRERRLAVEEIALAMELAAEINAEVVTIHSGVAPGWADEGEWWGFLRESLEKLDAIAGELDLKVGLEVADYFVPLARYKRLREAGFQSVGITLDTGHAQFTHAGEPAWAEFGSLEVFVEQFSDLIVDSHLHDFDGTVDHLPLRRGRIDFGALTEAMKRSGASFPLMLEVSLRRASAGEILESRDFLAGLLGANHHHPPPG